MARFDGGERGAVTAVVEATDACDTITLWNLLGRTSGDERRAVFERLDGFSVRPEWVLEEDVLAGRPEALEAWRKDLDTSWIYGLSPTAGECLGEPGAPGGAVDPHQPAPPSKVPPGEWPAPPSSAPPPAPAPLPAPAPAPVSPSAEPEDAAPAVWR